MLENKLLAAGILTAVLAPGARAQTLTTELVSSAFSSPIYLTFPPGDQARLFVVERGGDIEIIDRDTGAFIGQFLDITPIIDFGGEQGLLGLAFHPDYANNGRFFVNYTDDTGGDTQVVEYAVSGNPNVADPTPVQTIFSVNQPFSNHNGGNLQFSPLDGFLYIGTGDGGSGNDPGNRAQTPTNNLGKMLRFDVDIPAPFIPPSNPFVGSPGTNDEIWALGVRNPWRYSFDRLTGDLYIADVGQGAREEVSYQAASSTGGENYGWRCMEGFNCTGLSGCTCNGVALTLPVHDYNHGGGRCSITGGYVYRGTDIPSLAGTYFFADICSDQFWSMKVVGGVMMDFMERTSELSAPSTTSSFGEDARGEMYIVSLGGSIYRIVACETENYCSTAPNSGSATGALISSTGSTSIADNQFTVTVSDAPTSVFALFYYGPVQLAGAPFGDGFRCVGAGAGSTWRLNPALQTNGLGTLDRLVDFTSPPAGGGGGQITAGSVWNFQCWFRDVDAGGAGFNLSDALSVVFCP